MMSDQRSERTREGRVHLEAGKITGTTMDTQKKTTLLLVDDEPLLRARAADTLKRCGYDVVTASSGTEAIESALRDDAIGLVLIDVNLAQGIDGAEVHGVSSNIGTSHPVPHFV